MRCSIYQSMNRSLMSSLGSTRTGALHHLGKTLIQAGDLQSRPRADIRWGLHPRSQLPHCCHSNEVQHFQQTDDGWVDEADIRCSAETSWRLRSRLAKSGFPSFSVGASAPAVPFAANGHSTEHRAGRHCGQNSDLHRPNAESRLDWQNLTVELCAPQMFLKRQNSDSSNRSDLQVFSAA